MSDSPSARIVAAANQTSEVIDARGRKLMVRKLDALGSFDLMDALGSDSSSNDRLLGYANLAAAVVEIDGVPRPFPKDKKAIRAAIGVLGEDGILAVSKFFAPPGEETEIA